MKEPPETSTTLLRDIASDTANSRWGEFVSRYRPMMVAFLHDRFPLLDADDVIQETLVALVGVLPHYRYSPDETGHFRNYLTGILRNKALKRCDRLSRDSALKEKYMQEGTSPVPNQAESEEAEWRKEVMELAMRQLLADDSIHEQSKQIFQRLTVDGMSPDDVAVAYGTTRNNVDKIKGRMIGRMRELVRCLEAVGNV